MSFRPFRIPRAATWIGCIALAAGPGAMATHAADAATAPATAEAWAEATIRASVEKAFTPENLAAVVSYRAGADHLPLVHVQRALRAAEVGQLPALERQLLTLLAAPEITPEATLEVIDWLGLFGTSASVPALRERAKAPATADPAIRALALHAGAEADSALQALLTAAPAEHRVSVIDALGQRRVLAAVSALRLELAAEDTGVAGAAADALARIASPAALDALRDWSAPPHLREAKTWAQIHAARVLAEHGDRRTAVRLLDDLAQTDRATPPQRVTIARSLLLLNPRRAVPQTQALLAEPYVGPRLVRAWFDAALQGRQATRHVDAIRDRFQDLPLETQLAVLAVASERATPQLVRLAHAALATARAELRPLSFEILAASGDREAAAVVIEALRTPADRAAAQAALGHSHTRGLEEDLRAAVTNAAPEVQAALLEILGQRVDRTSLPLLLEAAKSPERAPRAAAFRGLAALARGEDLPVILSLRPHLQPSDRRLWQEALRAAVRGRNDVAETLALLRHEVETAPAAERPAFLHAIAGFDDPAALDAARQLLQHPELERRREMIRALASVRNENSYGLLIEVAENGVEPTERILALRGYLDTLALRRDRWSETIRAYGRAYRAAIREEEREAALAALAGYESSESERLQAELRALPPLPAPVPST